MSTHWHRRFSRCDVGKFLKRMVRWAVALIAMYSIWVLIEFRRFESRVDAAVEFGFPTEYSDLAKPAVPPERNLATALLDAQAWLERHSAQPRWERPARLVRDPELGPDAISEQDSLLVQEYIASIAPYFVRVEAAMSKADFQLALDFHAREQMSHGDVFRISGIAAPFEWRERFDTGSRAEAHRAVRAARLLIQLGTRCRMPGPWGYAAARHIRLAGLDCVRIAAARREFTAPQRNELDELLRAWELEPGPPSWAIEEELPVVIRSVRLSASGCDLRDLECTDGAAHVAGFIDRLLARPFAYRDGCRAMDYLYFAIDHADGSVESSAKMLAQVDLGVAEALQGESSILRQVARTTVLPLYRKHVERVLLVRLARVALAAQQFRRDKGEWPPSLSALGRSFRDIVSVDPRSGGPIVYRVSPDGAAVECEPATVEFPRLSIWNPR